MRLNVDLTVKRIQKGLEDFNKNLETMKSDLVEAKRVLADLNIDETSSAFMKGVEKQIKNKISKLEVKISGHGIDREAVVEELKEKLTALLNTF